MMNLPRILVLDDITGWSAEARRQRCRELALLDANDVNSRTSAANCIAEVVFNPAQRIVGDELRNDSKVALDAVAEGWDGSPQNRWALVLLDLQFSQGRFAGELPDPGRPSTWPKNSDAQFGLQILGEMARRWPDPATAGRTTVPVVALSARPRGQLEAQLNSLGNLGYLEREKDNGTPVSPDSLLRQFTAHLFHFGLFEDGLFPTVDGGQVTLNKKPQRILGKSLVLLHALRQARQAAESDQGCLLLGPSGAGKELFARYIHDLSRRARDRFEVVNCPAFPDTLIENELFGYAPKSGIHGADPKGKPGKFELADGGTVFMDEIGELSSQAQAKVLRVLQEKTVQRLSSLETTTVEVRIIAATNKDLNKEAEKGSFRHDLIGRLEGFVIDIPPLSNRADDIPILFDYFLEDETKKIHGAIWPKQVAPALYEKLKTRTWNGNVRELEGLARKVANIRRFSCDIPANEVALQTDASKPDASEVDRNRVLIPNNHQRSGESVSLDDACRVLAQTKLRGTRQELSGATRILGMAYGRLLRQLLEEALEATREPSNRDDRDPELGDLSPTKAMKLLTGAQKMGTAQAASEILKIAKAFPESEQISAQSELGRVLNWASHRRRIPASSKKRES